MLRSILEWVLERPAVVVVVVVFVAQIVRGLMNARKAAAEHQASGDGGDEERRRREVWEQIRRQAAERRGGRAAPAASPPVHREEAPPQPSPHTTQLPELFGGPLGRMIGELQRRTEEPPVAPPPLLETRAQAELKRQAELAEQMKALEQARVAARRQAGKEAESIAVAAAASRPAARGPLLVDLADPQGLRRAFVTREVLGPPVALR